ncbi:MAG: hypothetical protein ABI318_02735, partial [Chthoniobacteraceae bacterium]
CLHEKLDTAKRRELLKPLELSGYAYQNDTSDEPHVRLRLQRELAFIRFQINFNNRQFRIYTPLASLAPFPKLQKLLTGKAGFALDSANEGWLLKSTPREEIETALADLAKLLATLPAEPAKS